MTATYTAYISAVPLAPGKSIIGLWNGHATYVVKVRRIYAIACGNTPQEFRATEFSIRRVTGMNGGRSVTITKHDSANATVDAAIVAVTTGEWTDAGAIMRRPMSAYYPVLSGAVWPLFGEVHIPNSIMWDFGLKSGYKPLTLRQNQGVRMINFGLTDQGEYDAAIEFTVE